jgi:hypothetical protein
MRGLFKIGEVLGKNKTFFKKRQNLLFSFIFYSDFNSNTEFLVILLSGYFVHIIVHY